MCFQLKAIGLAGTAAEQFLLCFSYYFMSEQSQLFSFHSKIGAPLGRYLCTGVSSLDVEDIGLGSSGFQQAVKEMSEELKIAYINIRST